MTINFMRNLDTLQRFIFEQKNVRGELVQLGASYQGILANHPYPEIIQQLLGQALSAVTLLSATIKFSGSFTLRYDKCRFHRACMPICQSSNPYTRNAGLPPVRPADSIL